LLNLDEIRQRLADGQYMLSDHALMRLVERNIREEVIRQVGAGAEIIEDYPNDKYAPSCLLLGFASDGSTLHLQVSREESPVVKIITLYIPDPDLWLNHRIRKAKP